MKEKREWKVVPTGLNYFGYSKFKCVLIFYKRCLLSHSQLISTKIFTSCKNAMVLAIEKLSTNM